MSFSYGRQYPIRRALWYDNAMRHGRIEPRLLSIFRLYIAVRLAFLLTTGIFFLVGGGQLFTVDMAPYVTLFVVDIAFLIVFLYWPWLQHHLGRAYLPVALIVAAGIPILEGNYLRGVYPEDNPARLWVIVPFLAVPLILTAWQYRFVHVALFCAGTAAFDLLLILSTAGLSPEALIGEIGTIAARAALFLLIGYIVSLLVAIQRQQREELTAANEKLIRYTATLERLTITRERNRLARELHDTLAHTLGGLAVQLDAIATLWPEMPPRAKQMLDRALEITRQGLDETRRAVQELRAAPLEDLGLALALRNMARSAAERNGLSLELDISSELGSLPPDVEQCYYRVAQEALENVARHANAHHVILALHERDGELLLTVSDDGQGFDAQTAISGNHFGILGMRERAALIGGELQVSSEPSRGTIVQLRAPVASNRRTRGGTP